MTRKPQWWFGGCGGHHTQLYSQKAMKHTPLVERLQQRNLEELEPFYTREEEPRFVAFLDDPKPCQTNPKQKTVVSQ